LPPSTYYAARGRVPSARALNDVMLSPQLCDLWENNFKVYGVRKLWKAARRAGIDIGRDQTARLMKNLGIRGVLRSKRVKNDQTRPDSSEASGSGETPIQCVSAEPAVGDGFDVRGDLGRGRLCVFHHRCVLQDDCWLAGC